MRFGVDQAVFQWILEVGVFWLLPLGPASGPLSILNALPHPCRREWLVVFHVVYKVICAPPPISLVLYLKGTHLPIKFVLGDDLFRLSKLPMGLPWKSFNGNHHKLGEQALTTCTNFLPPSIANKVN